MNFFPSNLKILRKQNGLKQAEMPQYIGVTRTTWSNYENGISEPSIEGLLHIAKFFAISVSDLLEREMQVEQGAGYMAQGAGKQRREKVSYYPGVRKVSNFKFQTSNSEGVWERTSSW